MYKVILLITGVTIICQIEEILGDSGEPDCRLVNPYEILANDLTLQKWPHFTNQKEILVRSDNILTIVDPIKEVAAKYFELIQ
jgi:hypothetical protein